jgi:ribosome silencing factor RsfS/YbeB/iojap
LTSKERALLVAAAAAEKKGINVRVLDLREMEAFTDFFVICSGTSDRHTRAVAESVQDSLRRVGERPLGVEGETQGRWILVDMGDVVLHVFQPAVREFYGLERLWGEAESVELPLAAGGAV